MKDKYRIKEKEEIVNNIIKKNISKGFSLGDIEEISKAIIDKIEKYLTKDEKMF